MHRYLDCSHQVDRSGVEKLDAAEKYRYIVVEGPIAL